MRGSSDRGRSSSAAVARKHPWCSPVLPHSSPFERSASSHHKSTSALAASSALLDQPSRIRNGALLAESVQPRLPRRCAVRAGLEIDCAP